MSIAEATYITPEQWLELPKEERGDLVNGQIVEKTMGAESDETKGNLFGLIWMYLHKSKQGHVFTSEVSYKCFDHEPKKLRRPDLSFIKLGRFENEKRPAGWIELVPDLTAEVVSPNDRFNVIEDRVEDFRRAGTPLIWVVNPHNRTIKAYRDGDERPEIYHENDVLSAEPILPGFELKLKDIFPASAEE